MRKIVYLIVLATLFASCGEDQEVDENQDEVTVESLKSAIKEMDDSLAVLLERVIEEDDFKIERIVYHEAVSRNLEFYKTFPDHEFAPYALEKVTSMYLALKIDEKAANWRDTLIINYPDFERILDILELQKVHYDNFDVYEPEKIKKYSKMMLDNEKLSDEKREELEFRLEHIDKDFMELIKLQNPDLEF